ncbi:MAG: 16S rRNA (cytosine(1402)-N(4))-methyltransferase RsmH [Acidimicrobiales bacterium]|nr:MAG: 16S rRNA (cytosine(1402)-N(4))-methyltransferase RsmH [Acidimicrobiales bacterium]
MTLPPKGPPSSIELSSSTTPFKHEPVMLQEILETFKPIENGLFIDATVGGAGHAQALLTQAPKRELIGIDRDISAVEVAASRLKGFGDRVEVRHARFDEIGKIIDDDGRSLSGAIFDLGVSSHQLDTPERGFSHRFTSPLDMRMDPSDSLDASTVINGYDEAELTDLLRNNSDERFARRIAQSIISARPISSTTELAEVVRGAVPAATRRTGRHPAMRTFQAIRIAVNNELELIEPALRQVIERLRPGGRIVVLSYHSGEDRIVKQVFREAADGVCVCPSTLPCICGSESNVKLLRRKVLRPTAEEIEANPRSASARFRAAERLPVAEA